MLSTLHALAPVALSGAPIGALPADADAWRAEFRAAMDDDFNTPRALAMLQKLAREARGHAKAGTPAEAARELFAVLRAFDAQGVRLIWIEQPPDTPEWAGVRDRLQRASAG